MSEQHGPRIVQDGLVMCLDAANVKSFRGEPTTNVIMYTNLNTGWSQGYCKSIIHGDINEGYPPNTMSPVVSFIDAAGTGVNGYWYCYGDYMPQADSTTYSVSVWGKTYGNNWSIKPYTANNTESSRVWLGTKTITGDGTWQRLEWHNAFTTTVGWDSDSLSFNFPVIPAGQRCWLCAPQMEPKSYCTPFVNGTRGTTVATGGGFGDLTSNHHGTIVNSPLYSSSNNGCLLFDGVNDYITFGTGNDFFPLPEFTLDVWSKSSGLGSGMTAGGVISITYGIGFNYIGGGVFRFYLDDGLTFNSLYTTGLNLFDGVWHNIVATTTGAKSQIFVDGVYNNQLDCVWLGYSRWPTNTCYIGTDANNPPISYLNGYIGSLKVYNKILSNSEILQNYYALKGRYS